MDKELVTKKRRFEIIALVIALAIVITSLAGFTYSFFDVIARDPEYTGERVVAGVLDIDFSVTGNTISDTDFFPIDGSTDELFKANAATDGNVLTFSVAHNKENASQRTLKYDVVLTGIEIDDNFRSPYLKWQLYNGETKVNDGHFGTYLTNNDIVLAKGINISYSDDPEDAHNLEFYLAIVGGSFKNDQLPDIFKGGDISARIRIDVYYVK